MSIEVAEPDSRPPALEKTPTPRAHGHAHDWVGPTLLTTERGISALILM